MTNENETVQEPSEFCKLCIHVRLGKVYCAAGLKQRAKRRCQFNLQSNEKVEQVLFNEFRVKYERKLEQGLDTNGYSHKDLMWLGYRMALEKD